MSMANDPRIHIVSNILFDKINDLPKSVSDCHWLASRIVSSLDAAETQFDRIDPGHPHSVAGRTYGER